jgi:hypothetical protein
MPAKGTKLGDRAAQTTDFTVFVAKNRKYVGVRIGSRRAYVSCVEVFITAAPILVRASDDGLRLFGSGVVRQAGDTVRITP